MLYEKSLQKWMEKAVAEVNRKSEGKGSIRVDYRGSRDGFREILDGKSQPVIWNPADVYWPQKLSAAWGDTKLRAAKYQGEDAESLAPAEKEVIASTYLVMVMRPDRARIFQAAMGKSEYNGKTWKLLRDIAVNGWASVGGPTEWGKLKLIHTNPILSNSGTVSLALMLAEYRNDGHATATAQSPGFLNFMGDIERSMSGSAPETTSNVMKAFLDSGANAPDVAICYEVNAVDKINDGERIQIVYPSPTIRVQFPARILKASWVDATQDADARAFLIYLNSPQVQEQLIAIGFRSARNDLRSVEDEILNTANLRGAGFILTGIATIDRPATVSDIDGLQSQWDALF